jgi:hypothetical protein
MRGAETRGEDPEVQGTQYVGASNGDEILTLGGSGERRASSAKASARVQDPEARKKAEGLDEQGTQYVGASNGEITLTLGTPGERCASSAEASARAHGPEVQGTLEGAEIVILCSASIASTKEVELSTNFLELIREAGNLMQTGKQPKRRT